MMYYCCHRGFRAAHDARGAYLSTKRPSHPCRILQGGRAISCELIRRSAAMHYRPFGETNEHLSIVAMGGIVVMGVEQGEADRRTREAVDRGINYFDVAPSYGDAEDRLGP